MNHDHTHQYVLWTMIQQGHLKVQHCSSYRMFYMESICVFHASKFVTLGSPTLYMQKVIRNTSVVCTTFFQDIMSSSCLSHRWSMTMNSNAVYELQCIGQGVLPAQTAIGWYLKGNQNQGPQTESGNKFSWAGDKFTETAKIVFYAKWMVNWSCEPLLGKSLSLHPSTTMSLHKSNNAPQEHHHYCYCCGRSHERQYLTTQPHTPIKIQTSRTVDKHHFRHY